MTDTVLRTPAVPNNSGVHINKQRQANAKGANGFGFFLYDFLRLPYPVFVTPTLHRIFGKLRVYAFWSDGLINPAYRNVSFITFAPSQVTSNLLKPLATRNGSSRAPQPLPCSCLSLMNGTIVYLFVFTFWLMDGQNPTEPIIKMVSFISTYWSAL